MDYRRRLGDPALGYAIESSHDGQSWAPAAALVTEISTTPMGDGTERVSLRFTQPVNAETRLLLRMRVSAP